MAVARAGSAPMFPTSQASVVAASASSPGDLYGTSLTVAPRRRASSPAMSGETPLGAPSASRPVTSRKLLRLMPARSSPVGARAATAAGDGAGSDTAAEPTNAQP